MILFLFYAVFVWYFSFRWRRQWMGFMSVIGGVLVVGLFSRLMHILHGILLANGVVAKGDSRLLDMLLVLEAVLVGGIGLFFACLPRDRAVKPCRACGYELAGLDAENPTCPECGLIHAAAKLNLRPCRRCGVQQWLARDQKTCPRCTGSSSQRATLSPNDPEQQAGEQ